MQLNSLLSFHSCAGTLWTSVPLMEHSSCFSKTTLASRDGDPQLSASKSSCFPTARGSSNPSCPRQPPQPPLPQNPPPPAPEDLIDLFISSSTWLERSVDVVHLCPRLIQVGGFMWPSCQPPPPPPSHLTPLWFVYSGVVRTVSLLCPLIRKTWEEFLTCFTVAVPLYIMTFVLFFVSHSLCLSLLDSKIWMWSMPVSVFCLDYDNGPFILSQFLCAYIIRFMSSFLLANIPACLFLSVYGISCQCQV